MKYYFRSAMVFLSFCSFALACSSFMFACSAFNASGGTTVGNPLVALDSVSGFSAGAAGGALSTSNGSAIQTAMFRTPNKINIRDQWLSQLLPKAVASGGSCPNFKDGPAVSSACSASGTTLWLHYNSCQFSGSSLTWQGYVAYKLSSGSTSCSTFPAASSNGSLSRQYVLASNSTTPDSASIVNNENSEEVIDDHTANLGNFDSQTISTIMNSGYGSEVNYSGGTRSQVTVGHRVTVDTSVDLSLSGTLTVTEASAAALTRTINGTLTSYDNILDIVGTSTFTNVVHSNTCCIPVSGTITTTFAPGSNVTTPTTEGAALVGHTETLTLTGCGSGDLTKADGTTVSVLLNRCF